MKKLLAIAVMLTAFATSQSFAQGNASQTASVTLTVNNAMTLTKQRDLAFGAVAQGITSAVVNPITGGAAAAMFTLGASANTPVTVTFAATDLTSGANTIGFASGPNVSGGSTNVQASSSTVMSNTTITTNAAGAYFFWAGGTATLSPTQAAGAYSGSFTLNVAY
jgi:hypothetical protein